MKLITLEKILRVLETGENEVLADPSMVEEAGKPLEEMLRLAK